MNGVTNYTLDYKNKEPASNILKNIAPAKLNTIKTYKEKALSNLLIYGDNLPTLKSLLENPKICGKIKLIYIDPPFSTKQVFRGKELQPAYKDQLYGAAYLEFMRKRLILLRELLSKDGSIYVHLDNNMAFQIKLIMDEVFGPSNFRNWIARRKCNRKNYTRNNYGNIQDFILFYTKTDKYIWNRPYVKNGKYSFKERFPKIEKDTGRRYALVPIHAPGIRNGATGGLWKGMKPPKGKHWMYTPDKLDIFDKKGEIYWSPNGNPRRKIYADNDQGVPVQDIWLDYKDAHNQNIAITGYPTEKNIDLLKRIIQASSNEKDLVLDCFVGSGTTIKASEELNRRWIGIDNSKLAIYISLYRMLESDSSDNQLSLQSIINGNSLSFKLLTSLNDSMVDNHNNKPKAQITLTKKGINYFLEIKKFKCMDPAVRKQRGDKFISPGLILLDTNYDKKIFNISRAYTGRITNNKIKLTDSLLGKLLGVAVYDVYGNELIVSCPVSS